MLRRSRRERREQRRYTPEENQRRSQGQPRDPMRPREEIYTREEIQRHDARRASRVANESQRQESQRVAAAAARVTGRLSQRQSIRRQKSKKNQQRKKAKKAGAAASPLQASPPPAPPLPASPPLPSAINDAMEVDPPSQVSRDEMIARLRQERLEARDRNIGEEARRRELWDYSNEKDEQEEEWRAQGAELRQLRRAADQALNASNRLLGLARGELIASPSSQDQYVYHHTFIPTDVEAYGSHRRTMQGRRRVVLSQSQSPGQHVIPTAAPPPPPPFQHPPRGFLGLLEDKQEDPPQPITFFQYPPQGFMGLLEDTPMDPPPPPPLPPLPSLMLHL